ncbi:MAG: hypothetical protein WC889_01435 [Myxococcota bacterium]|jgi:hypothetical protein
MLAARIYSEDWEIDARLAADFGVTRDDLIDVIRNTLAERSSSVDVDPVNAPGLLAYIAGTRHLRWLFTSKGFLINRDRNVESVFNPNTGMKIAYQNVDLACAQRSPRAISGKKSGSAKIIGDAQGSLFPDSDALPEVVDPALVKGLKSAMWYLCASFEGDDVRAELSLPASVKDGNFHGFLERIFIIRGGDWGGFDSRRSDDDGPVNVEPLISRR